MANNIVIEDFVLVVVKNSIIDEARRDATRIRLLLCNRLNTSLRVKASLTSTN